MQFLVLNFQQPKCAEVKDIAIDAGGHRLNSRVGPNRTHALA